MDTKHSMSAFSLSRRTTLQMALAAAMAGRFAGISQPAAAQDAATGTWNWRGNAGNTGELPGPGLDLNGALGELWRIPEDEFASGDHYSMYEDVAGYANGVIFTHNGDSLWARRLSDGEFLWSQSPAKLLAPATPETAPEASPQADMEEVAFMNFIAIDGDLLLVPLTDYRLWALDTATGGLRWEIPWASYDPGWGPIPPVIVDHVAYGSAQGAMVAFSLDNPSEPHWSVELNAAFLGVDTEFVYLLVSNLDDTEDEIRVLTAADGAEYWRLSLREFGDIDDFYGIANGDLFLLCEDREYDTHRLVAVSQGGEVAWNVSGDGFNTNHGWVLGGTITRLTPTQSVYDYCRFESLNLENGNLNWELDLNAYRWPYTRSQPLLCAGKAYALIYDREREESLLVVADPAEGTIAGAWGSLARPMFIADGIMIARDYDTDEIFAIGSVDAVLQAGGRATVTEDTTLRGAPSETAIERGQVAAGTLVDVTGDSESANGTDWMPVTISETGESGWLPASVLSGQDGSIRFSPIDLWEFGNFTSYPKFTAGTSAEITETVDMRGAPSDTSARKATLEPGTLVTVTSAPTETDDGEWCPIKVDATGETGWVPVTVLKLVASA